VKNPKKFSKKQKATESPTTQNAWYHLE